MQPIHSSVDPRLSGVDAYGVNNRLTSGSGLSVVDTETVSDNKSQGSASANIRQDSISLSNDGKRAARLQELAKEFFGSGQFSSADLPKLLARLGDEGLLSESQMAKLQGSGLMGVDTKDNVSLKEFIQGQIGLLRQQASQSPLLNALEGADSLMGNMGMMYTPSSSLAANKVAAQLDAVLKGENQTAKSDNGNSSKPAVKADSAQQEPQLLSRLSGVSALMRTAAAMGSQQQGSGQINSYLALVKRY
ncbi:MULTISPECIES: hypothetical protein [Shewanella]|jgi:hypothetical protein|uniref:Uncharacterized protein n=1 Tax=Shewanella chilikensis TaxID=558541 RepID=A0ABX5PRJ9_9GAMM|nr:MULTISPECIES: hypothetical protein [Shewanella]MBZ4680184.1 hypothetical protein [Shewanella sp.]MCA0951356.1 hypothetical protein [Shewanella chilikensis]MCL1153844.1 hypothetical protein [Shewanella chilikensis]MCL1163697.1 hypothetical protein [Shewanella chilikensis]PYE60057.1 hypothetical protein C8J23_105134 [Shewanella chilikensis]